jgi:GH15 family glucan-1,4-alpha-glucosidase
MDSVYLYDRWYGHIPSARWDEVTSQTEWVCDHWDQPDEGIGETRTTWACMPSRSAAPESSKGTSPRR